MKNIFLWPYKFLLIIFSLIIIIFFIYNISSFKLDASSDTLILQNDESFKFFNFYNEIFPSKNFLVLAIKSQNKIDNDYIKTLGSYANYYTGYGWFPMDYNMKPGRMYMLNSSYDGELVYPENESLARFENNE